MTFHLNGVGEVGDIVQGLYPHGVSGGDSGGGVSAVGDMTTTGGSLPPMPGVPKFTSAEMPTMTGTAQVMSDSSPQPVLTPQSLNQKLPSIVDATPMTMPAACDSLSAWVDNNPLLAGGLLLAAAFMVFGRRGN